MYRCTQKKLQFLRDKGYNVIEIWECKWYQLKKEREDVSAFVDNLEFIEPSEPRDAFCGGRTNAMKLYHLADIDSDEQMKYYDFTSLYPWVNKNGKYPVGHPPQTSGSSSASPSVLNSPPKSCTIPYCPYAKTESSRFPCVPLVWKTKWQNPC